MPEVFKGVTREETKQKERDPEHPCSITCWVWAVYSNCRGKVNKGVSPRAPVICESITPGIKMKRQA